MNKHDDYGYPLLGCLYELIRLHLRDLEEEVQHSGWIRETRRVYRMLRKRVKQLPSTEAGDRILGWVDLALEEVREKRG